MSTPESHDLARIDQELSKISNIDLELETHLAQITYENQQIETLARELSLAKTNNHLNEFIVAFYPDLMNSSIFEEALNVSYIRRELKL
jgi:hypothetical protein